MVETVPTGNPLLPPPRRMGDERSDVDALYDWARDLYSALALEQNTIGTVGALQAAVVALQARVQQLDDRLAAIGALSFMPPSVSGTYTASELAAAYDRLNQIITAAKG